MKKLSIFDSISWVYDDRSRRLLAISLEAVNRDEKYTLRRFEWTEVGWKIKDTMGWEGKCKERERERERVMPRVFAVSRFMLVQSGATTVEQEI